MPISTNSIIHYTDSFEKLESIIKEGFKIKYCGEKLEIDDNSKSLAAHPMISFCDIPLSQSFKHFAAYGRYGIGLSKQWANNMGANPVLYLDKKSSISKSIGALLKERRDDDSNLTDEQKETILRIKCFSKNYSGLLKRKDIDDDDYKFYDEREWRLVPESSKLKGADFSIHLSRYKKNKEHYNDQISSLRFGFEAKDISYVIVNKISEIHKIIEIIRKSYSGRCREDKSPDLFLTQILISD